MALANNSFPAVDGQPTRRAVSSPLVIVAGVLGLLCGAAAFFILLLHDRSDIHIMVNDQRAAPSGNAKPLPEANAPPAALQPAAPASVGNSTSSTVPKTAATFALYRANHFQAFGPLKLKLARADARRGAYDLNVEVGSRSFLHRNVGLDEALWISPRKGAAPLKLVVTHIEPDHVFGYWTQSERPPRVRPDRHKGH